MSPALRNFHTPQSDWGRTFDQDLKRYGYSMTLNGADVFDDGFHRDRRGGTVPLAMLAVFLEAKITLAKFQSERLTPMKSKKNLTSSDRQSRRTQRQRG
jgi:hypothetical protein